jgi:two-component system, cell cycle sensor histidine kinase and response regulator CckA
MQSVGGGDSNPAKSVRPQGLQATDLRIVESYRTAQGNCNSGQAEHVRGMTGEVDRMEKGRFHGPIRRSWMALFAVIAMVIFVVGDLYYSSETDRIRNEQYRNLAAIAELKADQLQRWRDRRLAEAIRSAKGPFFGQTLRKWLQDTSNASLQNEIQGRLILEQKELGYSDVLLLDTQGNLLLSAEPSPHPVSPEAKKTLEQVVRTGKPMLSDLYRCPTGVVHIDAVAPVLNSEGQPRAVMVLRSNAETLLYPLIQSWPTPSKTAETLLVRKENDGILFLNDLRHRPHSALSFKQPLSIGNLPAAQAVQGRLGIFMGKDYRGVEVLADLRPIADSPWFMVTKVDTSEILEEANYRGAVTVLVCALFVVLAASVTAAAYRGSQTRLYQELYNAERKQREGQEVYRTTLYSIGDAVITTDTTGHVKQLNPVSERLTGWMEAEARGRPLAEVFRVINEESRAPVDDPVMRVLREGAVIGLANHTLLISKDGTEHPIADSGAPIRDEHGDTIGVVLVFRDQTEERRSHKALEESEQRYRTVANYTYDWEYWILQDKTLAYCSPSCERITGYRSEEFAEDPSLLGRIMHPDDMAVWQEHESLVHSLGERCELDYRIVARDGKVVWIAHSCVPVYTEDRRPLGRRVSNRDITDRKRAEEALRDSEDRYRATFNNASVGIDLVDPVGRFIAANGALEEIFGYTSAELQNLTFFDLSHPEDVDRTRELHHALVRGELEGYRFEKRYLRKDGTVLWADVSVSPIRDPDGTHRATVGVIVDITQRKKSEEARVRLATAVEQAAETIVITDTEGTILYANPAFETISGYMREEALGSNPRILKSGVHDEDFYRRMWETLTSGHVWTGHVINRKKDGSLFEEDASISPVRDASGNIVNYVAVKRDITREVSLQKQLLQAQKMEAIGTLAGGIAHDFNNLLQVTLGYAELLLSEKTETDPEYVDLQKIFHAARSGADLVKRLLTFSRQVEPNPMPMCLNHQIRSVQKLLARMIPKMIDIRLELADDLKRINADPVQVEQILMNLAVNARDAMPDGGILTLKTENVTIDKEYCGVHAETLPGPYALLTVSDTGRGMDAGTLEHIFEPFFTTKELGRGTGLGLAMVYGIVKQHGGHITCYSEVDKGTVFNVYLPVMSEGPQAGSEPEHEAILLGTETILLVDDEKLVRDLAERILKKGGYTVLTATNGAEALELYSERRQSIALVLLDLIMPSMGGNDCLRAILNMDPHAKVLIASGYSADTSTADCIGLGAKGFVAKPFRFKDLLVQVRKTLDGEGTKPN